MNLLKSLFSKPAPEPEPPKRNMFASKTVSVTMPDGTIDEYDEHFIITDGVNCVVCRGDFYHTSLDCENLKWERENCSPVIKGMTIKDANAQKITYCANCSREYYLYRHGKLEVEDN